MNQVILKGFLGKDAETRNTPSGAAVSSVSLATSRKYKNGDEVVEETEWHELTIWNKEKLATYLTKGTELLVTGYLKTDKYEKDGVTHYRTKVVVDQVEFCGKKDGAPSSKSAPAAKSKSQQAPLSDDDVPF